MITLNQILVATDLNENAQLAVRYAVQLARPFGAEVVGCHVLEPSFATLSNLTDAGGGTGLDVLASNARETVENLLIDAEADRFRVLIEKGKPGSEIVRVATNEDTDLIVVNTHDSSGIVHLLLGSTAEYIVRHAPCPVMVVREGQHGFVQPDSDSTSRESVL